MLREEWYERLQAGTENLTPWLAVLPCSDRLGLAAVLMNDEASKIAFAESKLLLILSYRPSRNIADSIGYYCQVSSSHWDYWLRSHRSIQGVPGWK